MQVRQLHPQKPSRPLVLAILLGVALRPWCHGAPAAFPAVPMPLGPDGLILPSDNLRPPYMAVYRWDVSGLGKGEQDAYAAWLNRADVWPESHQAKDT